jgi:uncharacterized protein (UPF0254 family)
VNTITSRGWELWHHAATVSGASPQGFLEKLAGKAIAITAILTLAFLLFPHLKPEAEAKPQTLPTPPWVPQPERETIEQPSTDPAAVPPRPIGDTADATRAVLTADRVAAVKRTAVERNMPSDQLGETSDAVDVNAYWQTQEQAHRSLAAAYLEQVNGMRSIRLIDTPPDFQTAYQNHIGAWQGKSTAVSQMATLVQTTSLDVRAYGTAGYQRVAMAFYERAKQITESMVEHDAAIQRTWDDVRRVSLAAGVDPAQYSQ